MNTSIRMGTHFGLSYSSFFAGGVYRDDWEIELSW
jgi:hypothetical protein